MALYKRVEWAQKCQIATAALTMYIKRGKAVLNEEGLVDDAHPMNQIFLDRCLLNAGKRTKSEGAANAAGVDTTDLKSHKKGAGKKEEAKSNLKFDERFDVETAKKKAEVIRINSDVQIAEMKLRKLKGQMIPTDVVKSLFQRHFKSMTNSFKNGVDKLIVEFSKRSKMSLNDIAELRAAMIQVINESVNEGIAESKQDIKNLAAEEEKKAA